MKNQFICTFLFQNFQHFFFVYSRFLIFFNYQKWQKWSNCILQYSKIPELKFLLLLKTKKTDLRGFWLLVSSLLSGFNQISEVQSYYNGPVNSVRGFPGGSDCKESSWNADSLGQKDPLEKGTHHTCLPTPVFLPGEFHGQRNLVGYNPWGHKESDTTEWLTLWASQVALVVKNQPANAGHIWDTGSIPGSGRSSGGRCGNPLQYFCLENPMDREHGGLESIGSQRVRHKWSNLVHMHKQCI